MQHSQPWIAFMHRSFRIMQTDLMWGEHAHRADELVFVRGLHLNGWELQLGVVFQCLRELRLHLFMWSCWVRRREESLTDRAKDSCEIWGQREIQRRGDSTSDLCLHISFICFSPHLYFSSAESGAGLSWLCASVLLDLPSSSLTQVCT